MDEHELEGMAARLRRAAELRQVAACVRDAATRAALLTLASTWEAEAESG